MKVLEVRAKNVRINDKIERQKVVDIEQCGPFTCCSRDKVHITVENSTTGNKNVGCYEREAVVTVTRF